ncbi:hypothetical protein EYC80_007105 [Monilinia laxa]|nr:hypothetical protein EYC80_007105 [Monilinia laxa]
MTMLHNRITLVLSQPKFGSCWNGISLLLHMIILHAEQGVISIYGYVRGNKVLGRDRQLLISLENLGDNQGSITFRSKAACPGIISKAPDVCVEHLALRNHKLIDDHPSCRILRVSVVEL